MKRLNIQKMAFILIFLSASVSSREKGQPGSNTQKKENISELSWAGKKASYGYGVFSGIGLLTDTEANSLIFFPVKITEINFMTWIKPEIPLLLNASIEFLPLNGGQLVPLLLSASINTGYNKNGNRLFYIVGGSGFKTFFYLNSVVLDPVINFCVGIEWLVSKKYALGFKINSGYILRFENENRGYSGDPADQLFIDFSITANLVL
jgi:hypothetical protein